jgi:hypothetical protein
MERLSRIRVQVGSPKKCPRFDMGRNDATMAGMLILLAESLPTLQIRFLPQPKLWLNPSILI